MADYAGVAIAAGQVVLSLADFFRDAKDAAKDIKDLRRELLDGMSGIKDFPNSADDVSDQCRNRIEATDWRRRTYEEIMSMTEKDVRRHSSLFGRTIQSMSWHWDKKKVKEHLEKIERLKSWYMVTTTINIASRMEQLSQEMQSLQASIGGDRDKGMIQEQRRKAIMQPTVPDRTNSESLQRTILQCLAPLNPEEAHRKNLSFHKPGASIWFIWGPLQDFLDTDIENRYVLWLKGDSGSGKTTLLAKSVDYLRSGREEFEVLCWYCDFDDQDSQRPENFLGWVIARLGTRIPGLLFPFTDQMDDAAQKVDKSVFKCSELERALLDHRTYIPPTIITIDAIDESAMQEDLELVVCRLTRSILNMRIIISSTSNPVSHGTSVRTVKMPEDGLCQDIDLVNTNTLNTNEASSSLSTNLGRRSHETAISRSEDMSRYSPCVRNRLKDKGNGRQMSQDLEIIPSDINVMYARLLENYQYDPDILRRALRWLSFSNEPLKLDELAELIVIEDGDIDINEDTRMSNPIRMLVEESHGLVVYDTKTGIVSLSHWTVREFLTWDALQEAQHVSHFAIGAESLSLQARLRIH